MRAAIRAHLIYSHLKLATLCHRHFDFVLARCLGERPIRRAPPVRRPRFINGSFENRRLERRTGRLALGLADDAIPDEGGNQGLIRLNRAPQWRRCIHVRSVRGRQRSSGLIRGHQRSSGLIRGRQRSSDAIKGHQGSSEVVRGRQMPSKLIRGNQSGGHTCTPRHAALRPRAHGW
jgi:hypothetical protein